MSPGITFGDVDIDVFFILVEPGMQRGTDVTEDSVMLWHSRSKYWLINRAWQRGEPGCSLSESPEVENQTIDEERGQAVA